MSNGTFQTVRLKSIHDRGSITEREDVHKKAFTKWLNAHLCKANPPIRVVDLISDLSNGSLWLSLFDVLLNTNTDKESGRSHLHNMYNLEKALEICQKNEIKIDGINASDIAEGNSKTILGLLWNIIVHFQMKGALKADAKDYSIEKNLQSWCLRQLDKYQEFVQVKDFTTSWRDGKAFNALLHSYKPDLFDFSHIMTMDNLSRLEHAFTMASLEWNVPRLLEPIDVGIEKPDKKMITMYLTCLYERLESPDTSRDTVTSQSQREVSSTSSVSRHYITTSSNIDDKVARQSKAFYLRKTSSSSNKSDQSDKSSEFDASDFPRVLIEEKKSIRLSSVSSDISSSSSSAEPLSPTSTTLELPEEIVETVTSTVDRAPGETDLLRRVKHAEMYTLSQISSDEETSPYSSSFNTDSDSTSTSTDTVVHVETASGSKTTTTTTTSIRRIQLHGATQGDGEEDGAEESTTTTVITETYLVEMPGESSKMITYTSGGVEDKPIEDKLSTECESILETTEGLDKSFTIKEDQNKILEDELTEAAIALSDLEPRVKMRDSSEDCKELIKERDQLQFKVNHALLTGRKMVLGRVLDVSKESKMIEKLDKLERRLKLLMLWPIRDIRSVSNYNKLLDDQLKVVETAVLHLEPKVKKSVIARDIKALAKEREDLELKAIVVVDLGQGLIRDQQLDKDKEKVFLMRMEKLKMKIQLIMMWPIRELNKLAFSSTSNYSSYLKQKFDEAESAVSSIEPRIKRSYMNDDNTDLIQERSKVYVIVKGATGLGHSMIEYRLLDRKEKKDFPQRIEKLEHSMNILMAWPIRVNKRTPHNKFLESNLQEVESAVEDIEPRIENTDVFRDNLDLINDRDELHLKTQAVVSLGRGMSDDKILHPTEEATFLNRFDKLETRMNVMMEQPLDEKSGNFNHNVFLEKKIQDMDDAVTHMEQRLKDSFRARTIENTALIKERKDLDVQVHGVVILGRGMIHDKKIDKGQEDDLTAKLDRLEDKAKGMMKWPIRGSSSSGDRDKFLDEMVRRVESAVENLEPRIRRKNMKADDIKNLNAEREDLETRVYGVVSIGRAMIEDKLIDKKKEKHYQQRIDDVDGKMKMLMSWPIRKMSGNKDYDKYFEDKLKKVEISVADMEPRIRKSGNIEENKELLKEREDVDVQVYGTVSLGRGMTEDSLFSTRKEQEFKQRMNKLEKEMKTLMIWPIRDESSALPTTAEHDKFLDGKLNEVASEVLNFEPRLRKKDLGAAEIKNLSEDRDNLEVKVYGVVSLGRAMIEDKLIDKKKEKHYQQRIDDVDRKMKMLMSWPIRKMSGNKDYDKYFEDKLKKVEISVADIEPRIRKSGNIEENKELLKEREDVDVQVYGTVSLGRGMTEDSLFSSKKDEEFKKRMNKLEKEMKTLMIWPIRDESSALPTTAEHDKFLDGKLNEVASEVLNFEPRLRKKDLGAAEIKNLSEDRDKLEVKVYGVVSLGRAMIEDKLIDKKKEKHYQQRIDDVDRKMKMLMSWPIRKMSGNVDYDKYFEDKLKKVEISVADIEPRIRKSGNIEENKELLKEREDVDVQVYGTVSLGRGMTEDSLFSNKKEQEFQQRMNKLEKEMKTLMIWPIRDESSALPTTAEHDKFLDGKLNEVASEVLNFEPRLRKKDLGAAEIKNLNEDRDNLEVKVYGVVSLGRAMIEDKLIDKKKEKHYQQRIDDVDRKMKMLMSWPIRKMSGNKDYDKYFEDKLKKVEISVADIEPRIRKWFNNTDNQDLLKERADLDVQIYGTVSLGRGMMEDILFSSKREHDFKERMDKLEEKMKLLMMLPIKGTENVVLGPSDHDKLLNEKLKEVDSEVTNFEPRLRKKNLNAKEIKDLHSNRDDLETKVYGVVSLGRAMIEDKLIDKKKDKHYQQRIDDVDRKMKMLMSWPIRKMSGNVDYDKYFEDKLKEIEISVADIEPRIRKSGNIQENKELLKEREDVDVQVYVAVSLGRAMKEDKLFSSKKEEEFKKRMEELEDKMKTMLWQIGDENSKPKSKRSKRFDNDLRQMEITVSEFEQRAKVKDRESIDLKSANESLDEIKILVFERDQIELNVFGLLNRGQRIMEEEDIDPLDKDFYQRRMNRLEEKVRFLREWLQKELQRLLNIYIILIKQHLERLRDWLIRAEARADLEDDIAPTRNGVINQYNDHLDFHKEIGAYSTINMILDIDLDDPVIDDGLRQDIKNMSERWAAVWNWSEERKKRLVDVINDWERFRQEERRLFDWLCDKEDAMRLIETTDISDAVEVESHSNLLQSIIKEMEAQKDRLHIFQESGEVLIANAQYHNVLAKPIRDEMEDFEECWNATFDRAQRRQSELKDSRETFLEMAELKKEIKEWLNEVENLLSTANDEREEIEQEKYLDTIRIKCEERDMKLRHMDQMNTLAKKLSPNIEQDSAQDINLVVKPLNRRWQDTSDKLDQCREHERPLSQDCWLVARIKNSLAANKKAQEVHFK